MEKSDFWGVAVNGKPIYKGDCLKWGLGQFADLRGGGGGGGREKREGGDFRGRVDTPMHNMF